MRPFLSAVLALVAGAALAVALPLGWVATHVADEDGYVEFTSSMIGDREFRSGLADAVASSLVESTGISSTYEQALRDALTAATNRVVAERQFDDAWRESQRQAHRAVFGDQRELPAELDVSDRVVLDLGPLAQAIVEAVTAQLPVEIQAPEQLLVPVAGAPQRDVIDRVNATPDQTTAAVGVVAVAAGLSLIVARRRLVAVAWLGSATLLAALAVRLLGHEGIPWVLERNTSPSGLGGQALQLLADSAVSSLDEWVFLTAAVGLAVFVVGTLGAFLSGRGGD